MPPKTKPEHYDIIFFGNKESDGFLKMLGEDIVVQMHNDIKEKLHIQMMKMSSQYCVVLLIVR
jgi:hypothetical protein